MVNWFKSLLTEEAKALDVFEFFFLKFKELWHMLKQDMHLKYDNDTTNPLKIWTAYLTKIIQW